MTPKRISQRVGMVGVREAKANLSQLLRRAERGEEIVIARGGVPVAKLVPVVERPRTRGMLGRYRGRIWMSEDFDAPLPWQIFPGFPAE